MGTLPLLATVEVCNPASATIHPVAPHPQLDPNQVRYWALTAGLAQMTPLQSSSKASSTIFSFVRRFHAGTCNHLRQIQHQKNLRTPLPFRTASSSSSAQAAALKQQQQQQPRVLQETQQRLGAMDGTTKQHYLADSPPTVVRLEIKPHFDALETDRQRRYAHFISR